MLDQSAGAALPSAVEASADLPVPALRRADPGAGRRDEDGGSLATGGV